MNKALIDGIPTTCNSSSELEKAAENYVVKRLGVDDGHPLGQTGRYVTMMAFIDGVTWQREQYKKTSEYFTANYCEQLLEENKLLKERFKKYQADNLLEREQLIKELREYCSKGFECGYGEVISCQDLLAKLDLLERGE